MLSDQRLTLESSRKKETELKKTFGVKKGMVVNLPAYKAQMVEIEELLPTMLEKLPDSTEVPSLLVDITEAGLGDGLEFRFLIRRRRSLRLLRLTSHTR